MYESDKVDTNDLKRLAEQVEQLAEGMNVLNETVMATFVQLSRIYDLLAAQASGANATQMEGLLNMHEEGNIFSTAPTLRSFGGSDENA
jgi:hypothetical protein